MRESRHFGLVGGLGVGATVIYYEAIAAACTGKGIVPRMTIAHANAPTALAHVTAGQIDDMAAYLAGFVQEVAAAGAAFAAIPAITPHVCRRELRARIEVPLLDILDVTAAHLQSRSLSRVALFGTRFTIDTALFGALQDFDVVRPRDGEVDEVHSIYLDLATKGRCTPAQEQRLRDIAGSLVSRDRVEAIVLAGTDLNLIFNEANAGFPAVDCAAAHIDAIVGEMAKVY